MDATQSRRGLTLGRLLLLALLAGIAWCALSLFASTSSASAAEGDESGSGLLGAVTQTVSGAGAVVTGVVDAADPVVTTVVETVVTPVAAPVPAPVAQPVGAAVEAVAATVDTTVAAVDTVAVGAVETATAAVADVADAGLVSHIAEPVVDLATSVPVVGDVIVATGLDTAVTDTASGLDDAVGAVVGQPGEVGSVLPELPLTGVDAVAETLDPTPAVSTPNGDDASVADAIDAEATDPVPGEARLASDAPSGRSAGPQDAEGARSGAPGGTGASTASVVSPAFDPGPSLGGVPGGALGSGSSVSGAAAGAAAAAIGHEDAHRVPHAFTTLRTTTDDALPGAPVFDTDVSPD
jgi:hypothetical protein